MNLQITHLSPPKKIVKSKGSIFLKHIIHPSSSMLSSPEESCLVSDNESRLGFTEPDSTSPSDDKFNAVVPDEDPNK